MTIPAESFGDSLGRSEIIIINLLMKRVMLREIGGLSPITQRVLQPNQDTYRMQDGSSESHLYPTPSQVQPKRNVT